MQGLVSNKWLIADGTKIDADAAIRSNLELVRESRKRLLRQLAKEAPENAEGLLEKLDGVEGSPQLTSE